MVKMLASFMIVFVFFYLGITALRSLSGKEAWELTKTLTYSLVCATLAFMVLVGIVILF